MFIHLLCISITAAHDNLALIPSLVPLSWVLSSFLKTIPRTHSSCFTKLSIASIRHVLQLLLLLMFSHIAPYSSLDLYLIYGQSFCTSLCAYQFRKGSALLYPGHIFRNRKVFPFCTCSLSTPWLRIYYPLQPPYLFSNG